MGNEPNENVDIRRAVEIMLRVRTCMHRWRARYAQSDAAREHVRETNLIIQEIDDYLLQHL